jgi:hypothetical protein
MARTVHRRRWTLDDRAESVWQSLPVEVPAGCDGLSVRLEAPDVPGVVVDIGCEGAAGWRGWSGGARRSYAITPARATPGYLPGELEPGVWHVVLGLHRLPVEGVELTVVAETGPVPEIPGSSAYDAADAAVVVPARPPRRSLPAPPGLRWVACDFHAHTLHSDGSMPAAHIAALGVAAGLDLVTVSDHNTVAHHAQLTALGARFGIGVLPGQEVTTDSGHANAFGDIGWVDFRRPASEWVDTVAARGGLLSVNHPLGGDCSWRQPLPVRPPLAEIWHSSWLDPRWTGPLAWWLAWDPATTPIGGSDWHDPSDDASPPGTPTTWVCVDADAQGPDELPDAVLAGLRAGRTAVSAGRDAPVLLRLGDELTVVGDGGDLLLAGLDGTRRPAPRPGTTVPAGGPGRVLIAHDGSVISISS